VLYLNGLELWHRFNWNTWHRKLAKGGVKVDRFIYTPYQWLMMSEIFVEFVAGW